MASQSERAGARGSSKRSSQGGEKKSTGSKGSKSGGRLSLAGVPGSRERPGIFSFRSPRSCDSAPGKVR